MDALRRFTAVVRTITDTKPPPANSPYRPLNQQHREIRIVTLLAGRHDDPIECSLQSSYAEGEGGNYEALSYVWGDPGLRCTITVDNRELSITAALECALRHLRYPNRSRRLWIDAICINQADPDERQSQVQLMRLIYQGASQVVAWLGPGDMDSDTGMRAIKDAARPGRKKPFPFGTAEADAVRLILKRPYWRRAWIRQEITVSPSEPVIMLGTQSMAWDVFSRGFYAIWTHLEQFPMGRHRTQDAVLFMDLDVFRTSYQTSHGVLSAHQRRDGNGPKTNMCDLLEMSRRTLSTDPRDHVYSILGLIRTIDGMPPTSWLRPDYTQTVAWTYAHAARMVLELEGTLEFLDLRADRLHNPSSGLPSWVPDFRFRPSGKTRTYPSLSHESGGLPWQAAGPVSVLQQNLVPYISGSDASILMAFGAILDSVTWTFAIDAPSALAKTRRALLRPVEGNSISLVNSASLAKPLTSTDIDELLWRTVTADGLQTPDPTEYVYYYEQPTTHDQIDRTPTIPSFRRVVQRATTYAYGNGSPCRRLLVFLKGRMGLGPPDCEVGDILCVLAGYSMPVILRPREDFFLFVGSVLVLGLMHGEALEDHELSCAFEIR